ncbi:MAG: cyclic lactone autoinducer peptide [Oscillospiraceae bacterium]|nr:cyclic lactone autoinducer peptide [Oscillospiraceae bacterium]
MRDVKSIVANVAKTVAEKALTRDANSTTCIAIFQPKAPVGLDRFKKTDKHD